MSAAYLIEYEIWIHYANSPDVCSYRRFARSRTEALDSVRMSRHHRARLYFFGPEQSTRTRPLRAVESPYAAWLQKGGVA